MPLSNSETVVLYLVSVSLCLALFHLGWSARSGCESLSLMLLELVLVCVLIVAIAWIECRDLTIAYVIVLGFLASTGLVAWYMGYLSADVAD